MYRIERLFTETLRKHNLKKTSERLDLFRTLSAQKNPCSIQHLVKLTIKSMNMTTVYRNIELFEEIGIVVRVSTGWKYGVELSDTFRAHHHHMSCTNCGVTIPFDEPESLKIELINIGIKHGFKSDSHILELVGICLECQVNNKSTKASVYA